MIFHWAIVSFSGQCMALAGQNSFDPAALGAASGWLYIDRIHNINILCLGRGVEIDLAGTHQGSQKPGAYLTRLYPCLNGRTKKRWH
jgi:hypothetical protein